MALYLKKLFMVGRNYVQSFMLSTKVHNLVIFASYCMLLCYLKSFTLSLRQLVYILLNGSCVLALIGKLLKKNRIHRTFLIVGQQSGLANICSWKHTQKSVFSVPYSPIQNLVRKCDQIYEKSVLI